MKDLNPNTFQMRLLLLATVFFLFICIPNAQPTLPNRTITITATQPLHFGTFTLVGGMGGGTVSVGYDGSRNATGSIFLSALAPSAQPAIFDVKLCQGRNVTITFAPTTILTGSNGGSFTLDIGPTERGVSGSQFPVENNCDFVTTLRVGGTLHVPGSSPPGVYSGSFEITFEQE
jgi:hypothetical protein